MTINDWVKRLTEFRLKAEAGGPVEQMPGKFNLLAQVGAFHNDAHQLLERGMLLLQSKEEPALPAEVIDRYQRESLPAVSALVIGSLMTAGALGVDLDRMLADVVPRTEAMAEAVIAAKSARANPAAKQCNCEACQARRAVAKDAAAAKARAKQQQAEAARAELRQFEEALGITPLHASAAGLTPPRE